MNKLTIKKLWIGILSVLLVIGVGVLVYINNLPLIEFKDDKIIVEINGFSFK